MGIKVTKECPECGKTITANRHRDTEKAKELIEKEKKGLKDRFGEKNL